jgi:hypothetical protein
MQCIRSCHVWRQAGDWGTNAPDDAQHENHAWMDFSIAYVASGASPVALQKLHNNADSLNMNVCCAELLSSVYRAFILKRRAALGPHAESSRLGGARNSK